MNTPFFFFGSLRDPLILGAVLGRDLSHLTIAAAQLAGHRVERAEGYSFPLLVGAPGDIAIGELVWGLSPDDQARIAYFEDSEYEQRSTHVESDGGQTQAVIFAAGATLRSSGEPWDLATFQARDRALLLAVTQFVMAEHYGVTPQSVMEQIWGSIRNRIARELDLCDKP
jgi:ADP-ribose pyrophosphatase